MHMIMNIIEMSISHTLKEMDKYWSKIFILAVGLVGLFDNI